MIEYYALYHENCLMRSPSWKMAAKMASLTFVNNKVGFLDLENLYLAVFNLLMVKQMIKIDVS